MNDGDRVNLRWWLHTLSNERLEIWVAYCEKQAANFPQSEEDWPGRLELAEAELREREGRAGTTQDRAYSPGHQHGRPH